MIRPPIFLIGCMRSGTTLLSRLLSEHPQIVPLGFELLDVWTEIGNAPCQESCEHRNASHFSDGAQTRMTEYFQSELIRSRSARKHAKRTYDLIKHGFGRVSYDWENAIALNKSPHLMNKLGYVRSLFPDAHFVFIIRDAFAQSASQKFLFQSIYELDGRQWYFPKEQRGCWSYSTDFTGKQQHLALKNFELIPKMWLRLNTMALNELKTFDANHVSVLTYESLVIKQEKVLSNLLKRLPLRDKYKTLIPNISKKRIRSKNTTTKGDSLTKWKDQLTDGEKEAIDRTLATNRSNYQFILETVEMMSYL